MLLVTPRHPHPLSLQFTPAAGHMLWLTLLMLMMLFNAGAVLADDAKPQLGFSGDAELGFINTSGNSETKNYNGGLSLIHQGKAWKKQLKLAVLFSQDDEGTSKEKYTSKIEFDRHLSDKAFLAVVYNQERDRFSGFDYQSTGSIGYGYRFLNDEKRKLSLESGPGYRRDKETESGKLLTENILHVSFAAEFELRAGVSFKQEFEASLGDDNSTYQSETSLKSKVLDTIATKISYKMKYVDVVPEDNHNLDRQLAVTLVYNF